MSDGASAGTQTYRGRFAPSPTGPLHIGSLAAALASRLEALSNQGAWLVRIEDIDPPREVRGSAADILATLEVLGFEWDEHVYWQHPRLDAFADALDRLDRDGLIYACTCSRRAVRSAGQVGIDGAPIYPGTCRNRKISRRDDVALRVLVPDTPIAFEDNLQGAISQVLTREVGDFVLRRRDGLFAYQLAVVVDDWDQQISDVVRGSDLLHSTTRQIFLQHSLGFPTPRYMHIPILTDRGQKLSKQSNAAPVDARWPGTALVRALELLRQEPPPELAQADNVTIWKWALANWNPERMAGVRNVAVDAPDQR